MSPFFNTHPFNTLGYAVGTITVLLMAWKLWQGQRKSPTDFNGYYLRFDILLAASFVCWALPFFFGTNPEFMRRCSLAGMIFLYISLLYQAVIFWYLALRSKIPLWIPVVVLAALESVSLWLQYQNTNPYVSNGILHWGITPAAIHLHGFIVFISFIPVGCYLLLAAAKQTGINQLKTTVFGLAYVIVAGSEVISNFAFSGEDTITSTWADILIFAALFCVLLIPRHLSVTAPASDY